MLQRQHKLIGKHDGFEAMKKNVIKTVSLLLYTDSKCSASSNPSLRADLMLTLDILAYITSCPSEKAEPYQDPQFPKNARGECLPSSVDQEEHRDLIVNLPYPDLIKPFYILYPYELSMLCHLQKKTTTMSSSHS